MAKAFHWMIWKKSVVLFPATVEKHQYPPFQHDCGIQFPATSTVSVVSSGLFSIHSWQRISEETPSPGGRGHVVTDPDVG